MLHKRELTLANMTAWESYIAEVVSLSEGIWVVKKGKSSFVY